MLETYPGFATSHEPPSEQREGEVFLKIYQEMVAISEVSNMFWGLTLDSSKRYTQTVERSFHISMAALEVKTGKGESDESPFLSVMIQHEKAEFLLCTLEAGKLLQQPLDLNFTEGEEVTFFVNGKGTVHLTGYLQPEDEYPDDSMGEMSEEDEDEDSDDDSDDDSDEAPELVDCCGKRKRKADRDVVKKKLRVIEGDDDFDDSDDEDFAVQEAEDAGLDYSSGDSEDSDDDDDSEDDDDDDDSEDDDSEESIEMDSDEEDNDEEDSDDEEEDSDEEDDDESEEKDMDLSGSFLHEKEAKNKKSTNGAVNGTPVKSPKKSPKNVKTETENTPKSDKKKDKSPKKQAQEKNKTPKSEKKEKSKSPKSEKKGNVVAEDSQGKMPKSEKKQEKPGKTPKSEKKQEKPEKTPKSEKKPEKTPKSDKKGKNKDQGEVNGQTPKKNEANKPKTPKKRVLAGGVTLEELKEGHGPDAKTGKMVHVYYKGNLQSGKQFDACQSGKPFKFRLGRQEVIKGWDNGLVGMKVGGKRKITIPPSQGYGSQRQGPIPANSTLVFEVELKAVS